MGPATRDLENGGPIADNLGVRAGSAFIWQGIQHVGVKAIYLVRIPILARLLSPDDFGLMAIAVVAVGLLMQLTDFGMVPALVQRASTDDRHYDAAWSVGALRALSVSIAVFAAAPLIARIFAEPRAGVIIQVLALRPLLLAGASIRVADLTRNLQFRDIAALKLVEAIANATISVALASHIGVWALVAGALAGPFSYAIASYLLAPYVPRPALPREATRALLRFGRWIFLAGIVGVVGSAGLQAVISRQLGTVELGLYFLAARIALLPTEVASDLVGGVAFPFYSRLQSDSERSRRAFRVLVVAMAAVLLPIVGLIIALGPSLVEELLGPRWLGTAPIIQVVAVASGIGIFANAAAPILQGVGRPSYVTTFRAVQSLVLVSLAGALGSRFGLVGVAIAWIPAAICGGMVAIVLLLRLFPGILAELTTPLLSIVLISGAGAGVAFALDRTIGGLAGFVVGGLVGGAVLSSLIWLCDRRLDLSLSLLISKSRLAVADAFGGAVVYPEKPG